MSRVGHSLSPILLMVNFKLIPTYHLFSCDKYVFSVREIDLSLKLVWDDDIRI